MSKFKKVLIAVLSVFLLCTNSLEKDVVKAEELLEETQDTEVVEGNDDEEIVESGNKEPSDEIPNDEPEEEAPSESDKDTEVKPEKPDSSEEEKPTEESKPENKPKPKPDKDPIESRPALSSNNNLSSLTVDNLDIDFNRNKLLYSITVENDVESVTISANAEDRRAKVYNTGRKNLVNYLNVFEISVEAENKEVKVYKVNITRKDENSNLEEPESNALLKSLEIKGCDIDFREDKFSYSCQVDQLIESLSINAQAQDPEAKIEIDKPKKLKFKDNLIKIKVIGVNNEKQVYTINVSKEELKEELNLNELLRVIHLIEEDNIYIDLKESSYVNKSLIKKIMENDKKVYLQKYQGDKLIYEWIIDGKLLVYSQVLKTEINFNQNNIKSIEKLINDTDALIINFQDNHNLPIGIKVRILVENNLANKNDLKLYYFNPKTKQIQLKEENIQVEDGYVTLDIEDTSDYVLSHKKIKTNNTFLKENKFFVIGLGSVSLLLAASSWTLVKKKKLKKVNINRTQL